MRVRSVPRDQRTVPAKQRLRCHRKQSYDAPGQQTTQRSQDGTIRGLVGRTTDLAPQNGDLVAEREQLHLIGTLRAQHDDHKTEHLSESKVSEPKARDAPGAVASAGR